MGCKKAGCFDPTGALSTGPVSTCADHFGTKSVVGTRSKPSGGVTTVTTPSRQGGDNECGRHDGPKGRQCHSPKENQTATTKKRQTLRWNPVLKKNPRMAIGTVPPPAFKYTGNRSALVSVRRCISGAINCGMVCKPQK
jgi:hypothetical protein